MSYPPTGGLDPADPPTQTTSATGMGQGLMVIQAYPGRHRTAQTPGSLHMHVLVCICSNHGAFCTSVLDTNPCGVGGGSGRGEDLLKRGGGGGLGREGVPGGGPPTPARTYPTHRETEHLLQNEQLSTCICHVVCCKQWKFIVACQFRVPTSHQCTTTTTKRDIHSLMSNDSDQSELDSPELEAPSVVELELEPDDGDELESLP